MPLESFANTFARNPLDRASPRRADPDWLHGQLHASDALVLAMRDGDPLVEDSSDGPRLAYAPGEVGAALSLGGERLLFLGLWKAAPVFAVDVAAGEPGAEALASYGRFEPLRPLAGALAPAEAAIAGTAKAVFEWRRRHGFCATCGQPSRSTDGGWKRLCPACGAQHFPRLDPVVIMLPVRGERCLLGRQAVWPAGMHSALAGFVEPGESVDEACTREVREECGLGVARVRAHSTQPWPYPHSLMIGLLADVGPGEAHPADGELEAVRWFDRSQARRMIGGEPVDGCTAPPATAIAHQLLRAWAHGN